MFVLEMKLSFDFGLTFKILVFYAIIDLIALPVILYSHFSILLSYSLIVSCEGICTLILGFLILFQSLFSTKEREDHEYIGDGFWKYQLKSVEPTEDERKLMRRKGMTMIFTGLLLFSFLWVINLVCLCIS
jgi:hypothetical protein